MIRTIDDYLWSRIEVVAECWVWMGSLDNDGYGNAFWPTEAKESPRHRAVRLAYAAWVGPIPTGMYLDHLCETRACVRPSHVEPVTPRQNTLRSRFAPAAINARKTACPKGHPYTHLDRRGSRGCLVCRRAASRRWYDRNGRVTSPPPLGPSPSTVPST